MTQENAESYVTPCVDDVNELGNDLLAQTHKFALQLKQESDFLCQEMGKLKILIAKCKNYKKLEILHNSYGRLAMLHVGLMERSVISHMASYRPLTNLIKGQNEAKTIQELEETPQLPEASQKQLEPFDILAIYKRYED